MSIFKLKFPQSSMMDLPLAGMPQHTTSPCPHSTQRGLDLICRAARFITPLRRSASFSAKWCVTMIFQCWHQLVAFFPLAVRPAPFKQCLLTFTRTPRWLICRRPILIAITAVLPLLASAHSVTVGRYLTANTRATQPQKNPLLATVTVKLPESVQTVGQGIVFVLNGTGYHIVPKANRTQEVTNLLTQKLPTFDRTLGPITVVQALSALGGEATQVLIDPQYRLISYIIRPQFARLYS